MSSILLPIVYPNKKYMFSINNSNFEKILGEVTNIYSNSNIMVNTIKGIYGELMGGLGNEYYDGSTKADRSKINVREIDLNLLIPNKSIVPKVDQDIRTTFQPFPGGNVGIFAHQSLIIQFENPESIPDIKYNVYIMQFATDILGLPTFGIFPESSGSYQVDGLDSSTCNILCQASSSPQAFLTKADPSKTKIARIGTTPAAGEYDPKELLKDLYMREDKLSTKIGNLKKINFIKNEEYKQIASNVSRNDTIIIMNHNMALAHYNGNSIHFDSLFFVPVGTSIDEYLATEKLKRELIRLKLVEIITGKLN